MVYCFEPGKQLLRQSFCRYFLGGHYNFIKGDRGRMFLKCSECGKESPGWYVSNRRLPKKTEITVVEKPRLNVLSQARQFVRLSLARIGLG